MAELFAAVVSVAPTRRRRWLWAAWWTASPQADPFRPPDASEGGAKSREEALLAAERVAGRALLEIDGKWARAWARVMQGRPAGMTADRPTASPTPRPQAAASCWAVLGLTPQATVTDIRTAFRALALQLHPDRGGDPEAFLRLRQAHDAALDRAMRAAKRPRRRR